MLKQNHCFFSQPNKTNGKHLNFALHFWQFDIAEFKNDVK
jgi:hypothetical protein